ncbi:hypothetical protein JOB18_035395 [Solea senegalensis]|nr:otoancorin [Solea senegalensis]KAG7475667.1 hypothetical protein JOB18_035395 [Solea senegalensis]
MLSSNLSEFSGKTSILKYLQSNDRFPKRPICQQFMEKLGGKKCKNITHEELKDLKPFARCMPLCVLRRLKAKAIMADQTTLMNITKCLRKGQLMAMFQGLRESVDPSEMVEKLPDSVLPMIPQSFLKKVNLTALKNKKKIYLQSVCQAKMTFSRQLSDFSDEKMANSDTQDMMKALSDNPDCLSKVQAGRAALRFFAAAEKRRGDFIKNMTAEEMDRIHLILLLYLPPRKVKDLPSSVCPSFLRKMKAANLKLLHHRAPSRPALIQKALDCLANGRNLSALTREDMSKLGQLVCELPASQLRLMSPNVVNSSLQLMASCKHIPQRHRADLKQLIDETYGDPSDWSAETMEALGPLLVLDENAISSLPNKPWMKDVLFLLILRMLNVPRALEKKLFTLVTATTSHAACRRAANITTDNDDRTQGVPTVMTIRVLGKNNVYWTAAQLDKMSNETFLAIVEILGAIPDFNEQQLAVLTKKAIQAFGPVSQWTEAVVEQIGCIIKGFSDADLETFPLTLDTIKDTVNCGWNASQVTSVWKAIAKNDNLTAQRLGVTEIVTLDQFLCGLNTSEIRQLDKEAFRDAVGLINDIKCPSMVAKQLKLRLVSLFGTPKNWTEVQVCESGNNIAELDPEEWKSLRASVFSFIRQTAIPLIAPKTMATFSVEQLMELGPGNAAMVTDEQRRVLSDEQRAALEEALTGPSEQTLKTGTSGAPSLGVEGTTAFMKPLLFFLMVVLLL